MTRRDIPNIISILRILLVLPVVYFLYHGQLGAALALFIVAGLSDAIDGYLAKRNGWTSALGAWLDPLADKLLLVSSYLVLGWVGMLPLWLVVAVILRDIVIVIGALAYRLLIGRVDMAPSVISKVNTFCQLALVAVLLVASLIPLLGAAITPLIYIVFATTVLSGMDYVWAWGRKAWRHHHSPSVR